MTDSEWERHAFQVVNGYVQTMRCWCRQYAPSRPEETQGRHIVYALHHIRYAVHLANMIMLADRAGRLAMKGEIDRIEKEIRELSGE